MDVAFLIIATIICSNIFMPECSLTALEGFDDTEDGDQFEYFAAEPKLTVVADTLTIVKTVLLPYTALVTTSCTNTEPVFQWSYKVGPQAETNIPRSKIHTTSNKNDCTGSESTHTSALLLTKEVPELKPLLMIMKTQVMPLVLSLTISHPSLDTPVKLHSYNHIALGKAAIRITSDILTNVKSISLPYNAIVRTSCVDVKPSFQWSYKLGALPAIKISHLTIPTFTLQTGCKGSGLSYSTALVFSEDNQEIKPLLAVMKSNAMAAIISLSVSHPTLVRPIELKSYDRISIVDEPEGQVDEKPGGHVDEKPGGHVDQKPGGHVDQKPGGHVDQTSKGKYFAIHHTKLTTLKTVTLPFRLSVTGICIQKKPICVWSYKVEDYPTRMVPRNNTGTAVSVKYCPPGEVQVTCYLEMHKMLVPEMLQGRQVVLTVSVTHPSFPDSFVMKISTKKNLQYLVTNEGTTGKKMSFFSLVAVFSLFVKNLI